MNKPLHTSIVPEDLLANAAKRLGEAKTEATFRGEGMVKLFHEMQKQIDILAKNGLSITTVSFEDKNLQAAWREFSRGEWSDMPLMETENDLVAKMRQT